MLAFYSDLPQFSFKENVADALVGYEFYPVELAAGTLNIQAYSSGIPIGVLHERLEGSQAFRVNLRGRILKCISASAIAVGSLPAYVKMASGGLTTASSSDKCCGIIIGDKAVAVNDIASYIAVDCIMP